MPYITQDQRDELDVYITDTINQLRKMSSRHGEGYIDGVLNYTVTRIVVEGMKPATGWRYWILARAYAVFMAAGAEFYRRALSPYETDKSEMLDLPCYTEFNKHES